MVVDGGGGRWLWVVVVGGSGWQWLVVVVVVVMLYQLRGKTLYMYLSKNKFGLSSPKFRSNQVEQS